jgi:DNA polymerase-1
MAANTPLQGTAADMIKIAMIRIQNQIEERSPSVKMIMQVHDELVFEVPEDELDRVLPRIQDLMENVLSLTVPLKVSIHSGKNWGEVH